MDSRRFTDWVQSVTGIAVVLGLGLVLWELQQAREVALAQLTSDGYLQYSGITTTAMGEDFSGVLERACTSPKELTVSDLVVLDGYYTSLLLIPERVLRIDDRTSLYDDVWEDVASGELGLVFSTAAGREWWSLEKQFFPERFRDFGDRLLAQQSASAGGCWLLGWQQRIQALGNTPESSESTKIAK